MKKICEDLIPDFTGYHFHRCKNPAKWIIFNGEARCGVHARRHKNDRKPIVEKEESKCS